MQIMTIINAYQILKKSRHLNLIRFITNLTNTNIPTIHSLLKSNTPLLTHWKSTISNHPNPERSSTTANLLSKILRKTKQMIMMNLNNYSMKVLVGKMILVKRIVIIDLLMQIIMKRNLVIDIRIILLMQVEKIIMKT